MVMDALELRDRAEMWEDSQSDRFETYSKRCSGKVHSEWYRIVLEPAVLSSRVGNSPGADNKLLDMISYSSETNENAHFYAGGYENVGMVAARWAVN